MSAREYLNETGLASLWAKIVNKINALGDLCVKKAGDTMTGGLTVKGDAGGSWVSSKDVNQAAIRVDGTATNGQRYDTIISNECYNANIITIGRITDQLCFGYVEKGQTDNNLYKFMNFEPANGNGKVTFGTSGVAKSYIDLNNGSYVGSWNGYTMDMGTNNTTDTWVPVQTSGNKFQHRVLSASLNNKTVTDASALHNLPSYSADNIPTTKYMAYWNGAYNSSGNSNLRYTAVGSLGSAATMSKGLMPDGAGAHSGRIAEIDSSGGSIAQSGLRYNFLDWGSTFIIDCKASDSAIGMVIATNNSTWSHYYIQKGGSGAAWQYTYNSAISSAASTYPQMTSSNVTINKIAYTRATFKSRDNSSYKFYAVWVKSSTSGG
jgi:hypothetical protein